MQAEEVDGGDKELVKEYLITMGFSGRRFNGETDDVNKVQLDIRIGHSKSVENVMKMLTAERPLQGVTVCDAGWGTGCLAIPLAKESAVVTASDVSAATVPEVKKQAEEELLKGRDGLSPGPVMPKFEVTNFESLDGKFDTVVYLDVLIHYLQSKADGMIARLASLAENRLIEFCPKNILLWSIKENWRIVSGAFKGYKGISSCRG